MTFQSVAKQYGIIAVNDIDDMIHALKVFSRGKLQGETTLQRFQIQVPLELAMADYCEMLDLNMVRLSPKQKKK